MEAKTQDQVTRLMEGMKFDSAMHFIAQGAINIDSGHTEIEAGSLIHAAMHRLCQMVSDGEVGLLKGGK